MESFYCIINDPAFSRCIEYNEEKCNTIEDIQNLISHVLHINKSQFVINDPPKNNQIRNIIKNYKFQITITNRCNDIEFRFNDGKIYKIINGYKMTYDENIQQLDQNGFSFSYQCQNKNLYFMISGRKILNMKYPFFAVPTGSSVDVLIDGNFVTLEYDQKRFVLIEDQKVHQAVSLIIEKFREYTKYNLISIINNETRERLDSSYELKSNEKYTVRIMTPVNFRNKSDAKYHSYQQFDYHTKISDAKQRLAPILSFGKINVKPVNIVIYDKDGKEITDEDKFLREIRDPKNNVLFDIDFKRKQNPKPKTTEKSSTPSEENKTKLILSVKPKIKKSDETLNESKSSNSEDDSHTKKTKTKPETKEKKQKFKIK